MDRKKSSVGFASVGIGELREMQNYVRGRGSEIIDQLRGLRFAFQNVYQSSEMQGGAKRAFDANVVNVHIPILDGLEELYHLLNTTFLQVIRHVREAGPESDANGVVSTGVLEDCLFAVRNRDSGVQSANENYRAAYNVIGGLPNEFRPAGVSMPSAEMYDNILSNFELQVRQMGRSLRSLSITFAPLTELIQTIRVEVNRVRDHVLNYSGAEFVIPPSNTGFADKMRALRLARQTELLAMSDYTIFGAQGGWVEGFDALGYFDDRAFADFLARIGLWAGKTLDELFATFGLDEHGDFVRDDDGNITGLNWDAIIHRSNKYAEDLKKTA